MTFEDLLEGRVKLEFGNKEQIEVIDRYIAEKREKEEGSCMYRISYAVSGTAFVDVFAETEEEAREIADDEKGWDSIEDLDYDFLECESIGVLEGDC